MNGFVDERKKKLIVAGCILAVIVAIFVLLLVTAEARIPGVWKCEPMYLQHYNCSVITTITFMEDGTYIRTLTSANTGSLLNTFVGFWTMDGFELSTTRIGSDGVAEYTFNPITGKMKNGDIVYTKLG